MITHYGERFGDSAMCGELAGSRTIFWRTVTCEACIAARAKRAEIQRYRWDGALCREVLVRHITQRNNTWSQS